MDTDNYFWCVLQQKQLAGPGKPASFLLKSLNKPEKAEQKNTQGVPSSPLGHFAIKAVSWRDATYCADGSRQYLQDTAQERR